MPTLPPRRLAHNESFHDVVEPFLQQPGLRFAEALSAKAIEQAFAARHALFATDAVFSTPIVLWAFLAQVLRDGEGAACAAAVADIATYTQQAERPTPSGDTGDYCRARAKLDPAAMRTLVGQAARQLAAAARDDWLWHGRHAKLIDGFAFTMPDTPANQDAFPQQASQAPGVGFSPESWHSITDGLSRSISQEYRSLSGKNFGPFGGESWQIFRTHTTSPERAHCDFLLLIGPLSVDQARDTLPAWRRIDFLGQLIGIFAEAGEDGQRSDWPTVEGTTDVGSGRTRRTGDERDASDRGERPDTGDRDGLPG